ncbi:hypothetical protein KQH82_06180 [bacterium]|nr:hypothetical protein [bacterium]
MGHIRLGVLPRTRRWKQVIELLEAGADLGEIAEKSFYAAKSGLKLVPGDPGFTTVLTSVFQFIQAARSPDLVGALSGLGYILPADAGVLDIVSSLRASTDRTLEQLQVKSDVAEMAQNTFSEVLLQSANTKLPSLFDTTPEQSQQAVRSLARGKELSALMHEFYARFTKRYLSYYLSRELPSRVGGEGYFESIDGHEAFDDALDLYVRQSVRISDEFTPGWLGKTIHEGTLDNASVTRYAHVAFKKIAGEFARGSWHGNR